MNDQPTVIALSTGPISVHMAGPLEGVPVVILHGNSLSLSGHPEWWLPYRSRGTRLIAVDFPAHGRSPWHPALAPDLIPGLAATVCELLARSGIHRPIILGHSLGGNIAVEIACSGLPCRGLALFGTPPIPRQALTFPAVVAPLFSATAEPAELDQVGTLLFAGPPPAWWFADYRATTPAARAVLATALARPSWHDQLAFLRAPICPVLWMAGSRDPFVAPEIFMGGTCRLFHDRPCVIAGASHMAWHDVGVRSATDAFIAEIG